MKVEIKITEDEFKQLEKVRELLQQLNFKKPVFEEYESLRKKLLLFLEQCQKIIDNSREYENYWETEYPIDIEELVFLTSAFNYISEYSWAIEIGHYLITERILERLCCIVDIYQQWLKTERSLLFVMSDLKNLKTKIGEKK